MAIYTKHGEKLLNPSLRVDQHCIHNGAIVKVWGIVEGERTEKQYWFSDLHAGKKHELSDVLQANLKKLTPSK
jgi:hypothetical protein